MNLEAMKVLFLEPYPTEGPSSRYRVEQYIPFLRKKGIRCYIRPFMSSTFYKILYKRDRIFQKTCYFLISSIRRIFDFFIAIRMDIVFIHLECFPIGPPVFEWLLFKLRKKIVYDLDDAIYMAPTSTANKFLRYLKYPSKVKRIIRYSKFIITCNEYLEGYAKRYNPNVASIHTAVDTDRFKPVGKRSKVDRVIIGWIGSHSTAPYLNMLVNVFHRLSKDHRFCLKIIGADNVDLKFDDVEVIYLSWRLEEEVEQFQSLDIGVYPLPDTTWTLGKTGFKTIQYMSVGIPCVASNVGANKIIIKDGENGFVANSEEEWVEKLSILIKDPQLRQRIGLAGRKYVEEHFSLKVNAPRYLRILQYVNNN